MIQIRNPIAFLAAFMMVSSIPFAHAGSMVDQLSAAQRQQLEAGKQVYTTTAVHGRPWPKIKLYQLVKATSEETAAISIDFEGKPPYTPRLKSSKILSRPTPASFMVQYVMQIPVFGDEHITHRFELSTYAPQSYRLDWKMTESDRTKLSEGTMWIEPYGSEALVAFEGMVDPGVPFASHFRGVARDQTLSQISGFVKEVEKLHVQQPAHLADQIQILNQALQ
jgi:hypothetical protein